MSAFNAVWAPGQTSFHPGPSGNDGAAIRWTSPITGRVLVTATFTGISTQVGQGATVNMHGMFNDVEIWTDSIRGSVVIPLGPKASAVFSGAVDVTVGDDLDFW